MTFPSLTSALAKLPIEKIDPGVTANDKAPWMPTLRDVIGMGLVTGIVIVVGCVIVGAVLALTGKLGQMQQASSVGYKVLIIALFTGAVLGSASALIAWSTGLKLA
ncbi:hypothetical protein [Arthrobacter woluwensis]|uniref:Integral membrane protein n=1 Tax=Arthrobacter woluwensis TaxID=156980 RepID=A0A1H4I7T2_9MICC|nr:hypothetical protein [Arthrobacter woluwensis]SEB30139.1 hypothetical protein SAMN04489745_0113 [Arthrobacter woluwensis]